MRAMAHSAASSDQTRCAAAEAAFAEAKAFLCSAEAQQMSESDLERELHRRGQELIRKFLQGHLAQRSPGRLPARSRGPTQSSARRGTWKNATRRRPAARCGLRASVSRAQRRRPEAARPRERRRVRRRRHGVVIDIIHAAECVWKRPPVFHRSTGVIEGACRVALGATSGRGRMDRHGRRAAAAPKTVLVYPVVRDAKRRLREG